MNAKRFLPALGHRHFGKAVGTFDLALVRSTFPCYFQDCAAQPTAFLVTMAHDVFVSYSSKDKPTADAVCAVLESRGIRCWVAPRDILPGSDWGGSIIEAIGGARAMVLIFSANANSSGQIKREVERAVNKGIPVIPLRIEDVVPTASLEYFISTPHWLDAFAPPLERHLQYLAEVVRKLLQGPEVAIPSEREKSEAGAAQPQPAIFPVASTSAITGSKEPSVWKGKRLSMVAGGGAAALLLFAVTALLTRHHRSPVSAEKDYAEGMQLAAGLGRTKIDLAKAAESFQRAAAKNLPEAEARLAIWFNNGLGGLTQDNVKAEQWAKKALEDGLATKATNNVEAQTELAVLYEYGLGVSKDESRAAKLFQKPAEQGDARAQNSLGLLYANGTGVVKDLSKAVDLYQKAAAQGFALAQLNLGNLYANGTGVVKDLSKAVELYQKAAAQGFAPAQTNLAWYYDNGFGVPKNAGKAAELYQKAADQGDARAQSNLAVLYANGTGVVKDLSKAAELYQKSAAQGYAQAQNNLGLLYQNGRGVPKDLRKAAELYQKATNQGNAFAQINLGMFYYNGQGVPKDFGKAVELFQKAADQGNAGGQGWLGYLYQHGQGVPKDLGKAVQFYQKAASRGDAHAQYNLGRLYDAGEGVSKDHRMAVELYQKAADQGEADAKQVLAKLAEGSPALEQSASPQNAVPAPSRPGPPPAAPAAPTRIRFVPQLGVNPEISLQQAGFKVRSATGVLSTSDQPAATTHMVIGHGRTAVLMIAGGPTTALELELARPARKIFVERVGTSHGASVPTWRIDALDRAGRVLDSFGEEHGLPADARMVELRGEGIATVRLSTDNRFGAGTWATWNCLPVSELSWEE
ncbi:MAG TPA: toll/interleukin-1 receptor domain-containing protein [Chthoniobacterales bacterium]|nr:toll/interleukin-1 receptor domain-containing protein [Chthoniobacterales bacterium]